MTEVKQVPCYVITARQARNIPRRDLKSRADPYVVPVLEKVPDGEAKGGNLKLRELPKSIVVPKTASPLWDYIHVLTDVPEINKCCITFNVFDKATLIGSYTMPLAAIDPAGPGTLKWGKIRNKNGAPVGVIEVGAKLQKPVSHNTTAVCKWDHKEFQIVQNKPHACMHAMYHGALSPANVQKLPQKMAEREKRHSEKKQCRWCNAVFTFDTNGPKACRGANAHAAVKSLATKKKNAAA